MLTTFLYACFATLSQTDAPTQVDDERIAFRDRVQYWVDEFDGLIHKTDVCRELTRDRTTLITAMSRIVRESQKPANIQQLSRKEAAIRMLGVLRASEACNLLDDYTSNLRRIIAVYSTKLAKSAKRP